MQPPTAPTTRPTPHGDEDQLYRRHHRELKRAVARVVNAAPELIEDACQNAWTILLRNQPERGTIFPWLRVVAIHEAYRLSAIERRDTHLEAITTVVSWEEVIADPAAIDNALEAREALRVLAELPARQRDDLALFVAGYTYHEIAELTGGRTFTNVNKHLAKARARIRLAGFALPRSGAHDARVPRPGRNHPGGVQGRRAARLPRHPGRRRLSVSARLGQTSYKTRRARAPSLPANPV